MIFEGEDPNYEEIVKTAETSKRIVCLHDFGDIIETANFGDVVLCQRCSQYFTKVKFMPRIVRSRPFSQTKSDGSIVKGRMKAKANHWEKICLVRVPVRIMDQE